MNLKEIKQAIEDGKKVYWHHVGYEVRKDNLGQYHIVCIANGDAIGLTWKDGRTLNGYQHEFFTDEE